MHMANHHHENEYKMYAFGITHCGYELFSFFPTLNT